MKNIHKGFVLKIIITLTLIILFSIQSFAQTNRFDSLLTASVHQIYNIEFEFEEADSSVNLIKKEFPNHPAGYFFDAMIY